MFMPLRITIRVPAGARRCAMSLTHLDVAFQDSAAGDLRVSFGAAVPPLLAAQVVEHVSGAIPPLTLGVLGSSHVVFVGKRQAPLFVEEVSCTAAGGVPLAEAPAADGSFSARVERLSAAAFGQRTDALRRQLGAGATRSIVAEFPGEAGALTALAAEIVDGGFRWVTWHGYPPEQLVWTSNEWTADASHAGARRRVLPQGGA